MIYIYVTYMTIYRKEKKEKEIWKSRGENPVTLHVKIFLITTKIFLPENYLLREWTWVSPPCPTCYRTWHSKTFLFSRFGHEQKNAKIASESSLLVTYQCSYCDGRENHPRHSFSTEATASYSHWRGLSELCQSDRKIVLRDHSTQLRKISDHHQGLNCQHL